jgi:hypothetical protein
MLTGARAVRTKPALSETGASVEYCGSRQKYCTWSVRSRHMKLGDSSELVYIELYITADLST